jgi:anti-anti-sigma regulatory factor
MNQPEDRIWVALHQQVAYVRVQGRASFKISSALKQFGAAALESGCHTMLFDLAQCIGMDSTFMGVLAGVAGRLKREAGGTMALLNMTPRTRGLVSTLGLDQIARAYEAGAEPEEYADLLARSQQMTALPAGMEDRKDTTETMLQAHQELVKLDPQNLPRFKDVIAFLRDDLKKMESNPK